MVDSRLLGIAMSDPETRARRREVRALVKTLHRARRERLGLTATWGVSWKARVPFLGHA